MEHPHHHHEMPMEAPANREGSGTSWQPDATPMDGVHIQAGDWMLMGHALINGVYVDQGGPRGGVKAFVSGMGGVMAQRGGLSLRAMVSPDAFMGKSGYPLLLASGEGLTDRQHPHDLFMELSARYTVPLGEKGSAFVYAGLPGEPAFGSPAFMHRASGLDSPEAPITHHWLDSTHVTFGVVTGGLTWDRFKLDASAFRGQEPDADRFDIETGELDSRSARLTFNPTPNWSVQASWASIKAPEEDHHDERRFSTSAMYLRGPFALTAAFARKDKVPGEVLDALLVEGAYARANWTLFARVEQAEQDELSGPGHGPAYTVRRVSAGVICDFPVSDNVKVGIGGQVSGFDTPVALGYGEPMGGMAFVRLKIG